MTGTMTDSTLRAACDVHGARITSVVHNGVAVAGNLLLWAIAGCESSYGRDRLCARYEPAYAPGGALYLHSAELRGLCQKWGALASCSYGSFQVMFPTAYELGFRGAPIDLQNDYDCAEWATALIQTRLVKGQGVGQSVTLRQVLDGYNSGNFKDTIIPEGYIQKGVRLYEAGFKAM